MLIGPITTVYYDSGFLVSLKGFVGAIIGGLVSYPLAAAGALLVGLLEAFASFWASGFKEVIVFTLIIPVLLWRSLTTHHHEDDERAMSAATPQRLRSGATRCSSRCWSACRSLAPQFWVTLGNYIGLYSIVALGLVLLTGVAGQTSFGQAAFVGIGAYTTAILTTQYGCRRGSTSSIGLVLTLALALCLGFITLRMKGHYLPLATIAWGISLYFLFGNLEFLGGHTGLTGIPALDLFGLELRNERYFYFLIWGIALAALWATANLLDSRPGRAIRALRGQLEMAEAFGVDGARLKIVVFVYAALLACVSGWLYAHLQRFVNPTPFGINQGIEYLFMAVVGGAGSVWGAVVGATLITLAKQVLQDVLPTLLGKSGNFEIVVFGVLMVVAAAARARRRLAVDRPLLPQRGAAAGPRRRRRCRRATARSRRARCSKCGGAQAVRRPRRGQRPQSFAIAPGEILGPHRTERRRQEHDVQPDLGRAAAHLRRHRLPRRIDRRLQAVRDRAPRHRPHVPAREARAADERARQRRAGRLPARPRRRGRAPRCGSTAPRRRARAPRRRVRSTRVGLCRASARRRPAALPLGKQRIVEIARALAADPALLLLDEPAAGLRYLEKQELAALLRQLRRRGHDGAAGRARHGFRHGTDRPAGRDGFRREARRRRCRRKSSAIRSCSKRISAAC